TTLSGKVQKNVNQNQEKTHQSPNRHVLQLSKKHTKKSPKMAFEHHIFQHTQRLQKYKVLI
ncbi:MAG: hypothetical protein Q4D03_04150, partial [Bacteroidales bacterium]|nr:hypothetical protein [Bacteroidales bacterium]